MKNKTLSLLCLAIPVALLSLTACKTKTEEKSTVNVRQVEVSEERRPVISVTITGNKKGHHHKH
jgi:hypothetical protein